MPEVDPATISRFAMASAAMAANLDRPRITDEHVAINPRDREAVYRRIRRSQTHIGAMFRGLETSTGPASALEVVAALLARQNGEASHGAA